MSKITDEQAAEIRRLRNDEKVPVVDLMAQFGVTRYTIHAIATGKTHNPDNRGKPGRPKGHVGLRNSNAKLDADAVFVIRFMHNKQMASTGMLAQLFGVSDSNIIRIIKGDWWKHVPASIENTPSNYRPGVKVDLEDAFTEMFGDIGPNVLEAITEKGFKVEPDVVNPSIEEVNARMLALVKEA